MPVENERKFILDNTSDELINFLEDKSFYDIEQYYLNPFNRIRRISHKILKDEYLFTFKTMVDENLIEVETNISKKDFMKLKKASISNIKKRRYIYKHNNRDTWEIDVFMDNNEVEKIVAEIELPEGQDLPENIPDVIQNNLIRLVDKNDKTESNYAMSLKQ